MKGPSDIKKTAVISIAQEIEKYPTVAIVDMRDLPAKSLQKIKAKIRDRVKIIMTRRKLINLAVEQSKRDSAKELKQHLNGMVALLFSEDNAFDLFKVLKNNMSPAPAKAGQIAPRDITIKAGSTPFAPGPMISELGKIGLKTAIEGGKIAIKEDKIVVKEGEEISETLAAILPKLDILPMKIGINLICALENGDLFMSDVLNIDEEKFTQNIKNAYLDLLKLAIGTGTITSETAPLLISNAHLDAKKLALGAEILTDETKEFLLRKAESQANALKSKTNNLER